MDPRTSAARSEALAAREALGAELEALEASARAAVDIPAKVRRNPVRSVGAAAGAGFLLLGGPGRVARGIRRALGRPEPLPKSMLPKEVERTLRRMGEDGERVRGTLEREFAKYLEEHRERRSRDLGEVATVLLANLLKPATREAGIRFAKEFIAPDGAGFSRQLSKVRERLAGERDASPGSGSAARGTSSAAGGTSTDGRTGRSGEPV